jgi:hypothetical protein
VGALVGYLVGVVKTFVNIKLYVFIVLLWCRELSRMASSSRTTIMQYFEALYINTQPLKGLSYCVMYRKNTKRPRSKANGDTRLKAARAAAGSTFSAGIIAACALV